MMVSGSDQDVRMSVSSVWAGLAAVIPGRWSGAWAARAARIRRCWLAVSLSDGLGQWPSMRKGLAFAATVVPGFRVLSELLTYDQLVKPCPNTNKA